MILPTRLFRWAAAAVVSCAVLAACGGGGGSSRPASDVAPSSSILGVATFGGLSHEHKLGKRLTYLQNPPVGGTHSPYWLDCKVYTESVPNEFAVHSMEHGAVWLTYVPGTAASEVQKLTELTSIRSNYTIVSPYSGQPAPIMATAWGLQLQAQNASDPRLREFVRTYVGGGQGGEPGVDCAGGLSVAQAERTFTK